MVCVMSKEGRLPAVIEIVVYGMVAFTFTVILSLPSQAGHRRPGVVIPDDCNAEIGISIGFHEWGVPQSVFVNDDRGAQWEVLQTGDGPGSLGPVTFKPGLRTYTIAVPSGGPACNVSYQVTGFEKGDKFVLEGPCIAPVNEEVTFSTRLIDPKTGEPEPDLPFDSGRAVVTAA